MSTNVLGAATEHPHVVRRGTALGSEPVIAGTDTAVRHIAVLYRQGQSVEQIVAEHPPLTASQVHDASATTSITARKSSSSLSGTGYAR